MDCCFKFDDKEIKAHRKLLSAFSSVFATMFNTSWGSNSTPIPIVDASYDNFASFLDFFYKGEIGLKSDNILEMLYLAHKYDVKELLLSCSKYASDKLRIKNILQFFKVAIRFNQPDLHLE